LHTTTRLVLVSVAAMAALVAFAPLVAPAGQPCSTCHTGSSPGGSYLFKMPTMTTAFPSAVPPGTAFNYTLKVSHAGKYTVKDPTAALIVSGAGQLSGGERASNDRPSLGESGGSDTVSWRLETGSAAGTMLVNASFRFTAHYGHTADRANNDNPYLLRVYSTIYVRPMALYSTATDISIAAVAGRSVTFDLVAYSELKNITITASPNLDSVVMMAPNFIGHISPGESQTVQITIATGHKVVDNGRIDLVWENRTGTKDTTFVIVRTLGPSPGPAAENPVRWMGRFTGILSLCLLISSVVLGYVKRGGQRRVRVHCAVSWFIVGLSVYHGIMLVLGPYNRVWLGNWVLLGYIAAAVMGVSGVNGLLQDWMTQKTSYKAWVWLHRITLVTAIVLVVIHAILMGTDFRFVRDLAGVT
jgi:hypothetical protein